MTEREQYAKGMLKNALQLRRGATPGTIAHNELTSRAKSWVFTLRLIRHMNGE